MSKFAFRKGDIVGDLDRALKRGGYPGGAEGVRHAFYKGVTPSGHHHYTTYFKNEDTGKIEKGNVYVRRNKAGEDVADY